MDELEISGKRYISAKRIAKENRYHPDYVGQLIRAGRISGTKVGRAWYVDEVSFTEYLGKERGTFGGPAVESVTKPAQNFSSGSVEPGQSFASASSPIVVVQAEPVSVPPARVIVEPAYVPEEVVSAPIADNFQTPRMPEQDRAAVRENRSDELAQVPSVPEPKPVFKTSLTYIPDNSPLFPAIQKRTKPVETKKDEYVVAQIAKPMHTAQPIARPKRNGWKTSFAAVSVVVIAGIFFSFTFFGSLGINSTVIIEKGKPASVIFAQEKTFCFIFNVCQNN